MNIAHFSSAYYPSPGGVEEFVRQLSGQQRLNGGAPLIVTNRWPKNLPAREIYEQVPVRRFPFRVPEPNWRQWTGAALLGPPTLLRILRLLCRHRTEVIHIQCVSSNAYYALLASRILGLPLVATLHGELTVDDSRLFQRSRFAQGLLRAVLDKADAITACSENTLEEAKAFYGRPFTAPSMAIHNGVRMDDFSGAQPYPHPRPYVLAIGRHVRQKGFDILLRAFARVIHGGLSTHDLVIAGDGPERGSLERLNEQLGIRQHVHFLGVSDRPTTARLFVGCSFFVLPSRQEPLGIVNLEAMAAGKAVLATRVGGVPEIILHERTGLLIAPENIEALAEGLRRLISNAGLRARLGASGHEHAHCFHWATVAEQYELIYSSLRQQKPEPTAQPATANG